MHVITISGKRISETLHPLKIFYTIRRITLFIFQARRSFNYAITRALLGVIEPKCRKKKCKVRGLRGNLIHRAALNPEGLLNHGR